MRKGGTYDVIVVGGGIFGLNCAYAAARDGLYVCVLEAESPGAGASGGIVGALSPHQPLGWSPKKQIQLDALILADSFWADVGLAGGLHPGYARTGRYLPIGTPRALEKMAAQRDAAREAWPEAFCWQIVPPGELPSWLDPAAFPLGAVFESLSARLHPRRALAALTAAIASLGGEIRTHVRVVRVEPDFAEVDDGRIEADAIVVAAGLGGPDLVRPILPGTGGIGVKGQAALLSECADPPAAMVCSDGVYIVPHADGTVAVGSTSEKLFADPTATDDQLDALIARARRLCPGLAEARILERWAGVRPRGPAADPIVGPVPDWPNVFVANGGFKTGFGFAPLIGRAVADMIAGRPHQLPAGFMPSNGQFRA
jgi:glycine oxidase